MFYIYSFHFGIIIFVFYPEAVVRRFYLKKVFLKISQNTCTGLSFLVPLAALLMKRLRHSVFKSRWLISQKAPSQMFNWVITTPLYYPSILNRSTKTFFYESQWQKLLPCILPLIQRDKIEQQSSTSSVNESNSSATEHFFAWCVFA